MGVGGWRLCRSLRWGSLSPTPHLRSSLRLGTGCGFRKLTVSHGRVSLCSSSAVLIDRTPAAACTSPQDSGHGQGASTRTTLSRPAPRLAGPLGKNGGWEMKKSAPSVDPSVNRPCPPQLQDCSQVLEERRRGWPWPLLTPVQPGSCLWACPMSLLQEIPGGSLWASALEFGWEGVCRHWEKPSCMGGHAFPPTPDIRCPLHTNPKPSTAAQRESEHLDGSLGPQCGLRGLPSTLTQPPRELSKAAHPPETGVSLPPSRPLSSPTCT